MQPNDKITKWKRQNKLILTGMILFTFAIILLQLSFTSTLKGPFGILITFILLVGSYALVIYPKHKLRWFLWAFKNENNKGELFRLAVDQKIIHEHNNSFAFANSEEKELIKKYYDLAKDETLSAQKNIEIEEELLFYNDKSKIIGYSFYASISFILFMIFLLLGLSKEFEGFNTFGNIIIGLIPLLAIFGTLGLINTIRNVFDNSIKLRINTKGIQIKKNHFHLWNDIRHFDVKESSIRTGKSTTYVPMLHLKIRGIEERLDISYLPVSMDELRDLITEYKINAGKEKSLEQLEN
ncbi:hypothetical protein [Flammeovirga sp. OC4]|uniref:hypothetical protein n=1 Tax=Flammeovirga sp. OC4 TaxID=1382345 RepID=UPI0005C5D864|nr:hypothetical protein [Flammeovirga sp. OC4]